MPHRDEFLSCPSCGAALDPAGTRLSCSQCRGSMIGLAELDQMVHEMSPDRPERSIAERLRPATGTPAVRPCPRCKATMSAHEVDGVTIDRCAEHGIWFDGAELARVLEASGMDHVARQRNRSLRGMGVFRGAGIGPGAMLVHALIRWWTSPRRPKDLDDVGRKR